MDKRRKRWLIVILNVILLISITPVCLLAKEPENKTIDVWAKYTKDEYPDVYSAEISLFKKATVEAGDYSLQFSSTKLFSSTELVIHQIHSGTDGYDWFESCMAGIGGEIAPFDIYCVKNGEKAELSSNVNANIVLPETYEQPALYYLDTNGNASSVSFEGNSGSYTFTISKNGYYVFVDLADVETGTEPIVRHMIISSAGTGGSISPEGQLSVVNGQDVNFIISANNNYKISNVLVDGESVGAVSSYTFHDVAEEHTIEAEFLRTNMNIISIIKDWFDNIFSWWI